MRLILKGLLHRIAGRAYASEAEIKRIRQAAQEAEKSSVLCNLGCGTRTHGDWINIDFHGDGRAVFSWDLRLGVPLPDRACDAVYSSHVIEHFSRDGARRFLDECRRVLKPGGIIRLVAPDLEGIIRAYLSCLEAVRQGNHDAADKYEWMVIELLDQMLRHRSGGEMLKYWCRPIVPAEHFIVDRVGTEYWRARKHCKGRVIGEKPLDAKEVGEFRLGGEVHQWMYDSYSLGKLLADCGFRRIRQCKANESGIEGFAGYHLDTEPDGSIYKPDSFFMEAIAP
jgi:predicted SAM-dependent methyltransferase